MISGPRRETLLEQTSNEDTIHKSLLSKSVGGDCLHVLNQTSYRMCSWPQSQTNEYKQKTSKYFSFYPFLLPFFLLDSLCN